MKKVLAMSILTMIVMSMGGCGASSDSSSSQDVSSKAETESNSPYTVEADFSKGASNDFSISLLVENSLSISSGMFFSSSLTGIMTDISYIGSPSRTKKTEKVI